MSLISFVGKNIPATKLKTSSIYAVLEGLRGFVSRKLVLLPFPKTQKSFFYFVFLQNPNINETALLQTTADPKTAFPVILLLLLKYLSGFCRFGGHKKPVPYQSTVRDSIFLIQWLQGQVMPLPLTADGDHCFPGVHRLLPYKWYGSGIRSALAGPSILTPIQLSHHHPR